MQRRWRAKDQRGGFSAGGGRGRAPRYSGVYSSVLGRPWGKGRAGSGGHEGAHVTGDGGGACLIPPPLITPPNMPPPPPKLREKGTWGQRLTRELVAEQPLLHGDGFQVAQLLRGGPRAQREADGALPEGGVILLGGKEEGGREFSVLRFRPPARWEGMVGGRRPRAWMRGAPPASGAVGTGRGVRRARAGGRQLRLAPCLPRTPSGSHTAATGAR